MMRELVGAGIQLLIGQGLAGALHRRCLRGTGRLGFEQLVNTGSMRILPFSLIPFDEHFMPLVPGERSWLIVTADCGISAHKIKMGMSVLYTHRLTLAWNL